MSFSVSHLRSYLKDFANAWAYIYSKGDPDKSVDEVSSLRGYFDQEMKDTLHKAGIVYVDENTIDLDLLKTFPQELGLFSPKTEWSDGNFFLDGRYVLPIKDIQGNVIALVGWYPDRKKYLTTGSYYFSKSTLFYGMENLHKGAEAGPTFIVEGIFDRLTIESYGYRSFATMGINADKKKTVLYNLTGRVVGIPDTDTAGRRVALRDEWSLPTGSSYFRWKGTVSIPGVEEAFHPKDIDILSKVLDREYMGELLSDVYATPGRRVITLDLN